MKRFAVFGALGLGLCLLIACGAATTPLPNATVMETEGVATPTTVEPTGSTPTATLQAAEIPTQNTLAPADFSLSDAGPYFAGNREYTLVDGNRDGREIGLLIWYPARKQTDANGRPIVRNAAPDMSNAPYPLILTEADSGRYIFLSHLATHGFVLVVVKSPLSGQAEQLEDFLWIEPVRDYLFTLEQLSSSPPIELNSLIDTDHVGVTGYSYGGDISLVLSGARVDPAFYRSQCAQMTSLAPEPLQWVYTKWTCLDYRNWDEFAALVGEEITTGDGGLWQPITDERIRAVMPMAPTVSWYFGERGLAAVDRPILLVWGTEDVDSPYQLEAGYTYENLVIPDKFLISFVGRTHGMPFVDDAALRLKHFAMAFFGYYLQGREEYAEYFSEDFVAQFGDLAWGVVVDE